MNLETLAKAAGAVPDADPNTLAAARHQLDRAINASDTRVTVLRRSRNRRRWGATLLASAAVTGAVFAGPVINAAPASAQEVMLAAADAAGDQFDEVGEAPYWHVVSEEEVPGVEPFRRETWVGRNGDWIYRSEEDAARHAAKTGGPLDPEHIRTEIYPGEDDTFEVVEALPTDPGRLEAALRAKIREYGPEEGEESEGWDPDAELMGQVVELLFENPASPSLRQAAWEVAATIPDVEVIGDLTDSFGRRGTALEWVSNPLEDQRSVVIIDPSSGIILEERYIRGTENVGRWTLVEQGPTATVPEADCEPGTVGGRPCY